MRHLHQGLPEKQIALISWRKPHIEFALQTYRNVVISRERSEYIAIKAALANEFARAAIDFSASYNVSFKRIFTPGSNVARSTASVYSSTVVAFLISFHARSFA